MDKEEGWFWSGVSITACVLLFSYAVLVPGCVRDARLKVYREAVDRGYGEFVSENGSTVQFRWKEGK